MATTLRDPKAPLLRYLRVQADFDVVMRSVLQNAYEDSSRVLKELEGRERIGQTIRARQMREAQSAIRSSLNSTWSSTGTAIREHRTRAAAAAVDAAFDPLIPLLQDVGYGDRAIDAMLRSQRATAERGVQNAVSRVSLTRIPLSEQVYRTSALASGQLDRMVTSAIARGVSAAELARAVTPFIDPNTPGGVRYAAMRLGRTELNNAFHGTQVMEATRSPFVVAMRWNLSGSHPRPDSCDDYAENGDVGGGLWTPQEIPEKPHPHCLCFMTPEMPSREEFLRQYRAGQYDQWLEENDAPRPVTLSSARPMTDWNSSYLKEHQSWRSTLSSAERSAQEDYVVHGHAMNRALRFPGEASSTETKARVQEFDRVFASRAAALQQRSTVSRVVYEGDQFQPRIAFKAGQDFVEPGWSSTTVDQGTIDWAASSAASWVVDIQLPVGARYAYGGEGMREIVLPRNSRFKVVSVDPESQRVSLEYLP